jgi:O-antigen ligase
MTAVLRRDFAVLGFLVLLQAVALVWLGDVFSAGPAVVVLSGILVGGLVLPPAGARALSGIRGLVRQLRWWHWLWALLFFSDLVFRARDAQSVRDNPLDAWALYRVILVGLAGMVLLWRAATRRGEWVRSLFSGMVLIMAAFPLVGILSTAWSVFPAWTFYKSIELLIDVSVLAAALAAAGTVGNLKSLFDWNWLLLAGIQATVWIGAAIWPQEALIRGVGTLGVQLTGVVPGMSSNGVGHIAAILSIVALARMLDRGARHGSVLLYSMVFLSSAATLVFSQTRSALGAFVAAAALVLLLSRRTGLIATVVLATFVLLTASAFESTFLTYLRRGQDAQLLESFSGRTDWWRFAWVRFLERPLTGYGAFAGGRFASLAEMGDQTTSSLHNSYLEAMLGVGILGLLPVLACLIATWWRLLQSFFRWTSGEIERSLRLEAIGVLMVISVRSVFTTDLIWHPALSWFLVLGCAELLRPERRREVA